MSHIRLSLAAAASALLAATALRAQERPRLVVLCAVDQLADWVFDRVDPFFADGGGFRRLQRQGVRFDQCEFEHACSETGPGHATIGTGAPASRHGIVKNSWYEPDGHSNVYCVGEPAEALPDLPEGKDRGPGRLTAMTLATVLKAHVPGSKVASVSFKDRSAILMAGPDADVAAWIERGRGMLVTNRNWAEATPVWMQQFNDSRAIDTFFGKAWDRSGPAAAYEGLVDDRPFESVHLNGSLSRTLPQPVTGGKEEPTMAYYDQLYGTPFGNTVVRLAAEAALRGMQLGQDDAPDLLCVSFSSTDVVGHYFGPMSVEARDTLLRLDQDLAAMFRTFDEVVGEQNWTIFLTADHGVAPVPEAAAQNGVAAGRGLLDTWVRSAVETRLREAYGELPEGKRYCAHIGEGSIYLDDEAVELAAKHHKARRKDMARQAAVAAGRVRGMQIAYATEDVLESRDDDPIVVALQRAIAPGRAGDVQLVSKPYWINGATPATHGTAHHYDREVVGFAMGPGVPLGQRIATPITPGFGAVLFAELLGIPRPSSAHERVPAPFCGQR